MPERPKGSRWKREAQQCAMGSNPILSASTKHAEVAQLVERHPSKVDVAGSNPVFRSAPENMPLAEPEQWHTIPNTSRPCSSVGRASHS
jgi:hypothetical protein